MKRFAAFLVCAVTLSAQSSEPYVPTGVELQLVEQRAEGLGREIAGLRSRKINDALIAEVEFFHKALEWQIRFPEEIYRRHYLHDALAAAAVGVGDGGGDSTGIAIGGCIETISPSQCGNSVYR